MTTEVTAPPPELAANSLCPGELDDSSTVAPVVTGVPAVVVSSTVIGPRTGLAVAAPLTAGEVIVAAVPVTPAPGSPGSTAPDDGATACWPGSAVTWFGPAFLALSAAVLAALVALAALAALAAPPPT